MQSTSKISNGLDEQLRQKIVASREILKSCGSVVVAFSGGVDSTFLLALAVETLGSEKVLAVMGISGSLAQREQDAGQRIAHQIGAEFCEIETNELTDPRYAANPPERCYYCKAELFGRLKQLADERGYSTIVSGANADDRGDFRPGLQAGEELGVRRPLMEAELTKSDIRTASRAMGLETWDKPAMACLSSRIPYGQEVTPTKLARIEKAEYILKDLGFTQCRVRDHDEMARIEVVQADIPRLLELRESIVAPFKELGYVYVTVDMQGFRSGSMNEAIGRP